MGNVMIMSRRNHVDRKWTRNKHCKYLPCKIIKISLKHYHIFGSIVLTSLLSGRESKNSRRETKKINFISLFSFSHVQVHRNLEEKLKFSDTEERFKKIEEKMENLLSGKDEKTREPQPSSNRSTAEEGESSFRSRVLHLEKEKSELRKELEEAIAGRKKAEENTRR